MKALLKELKETITANIKNDIREMIRDLKEPHINGEGHLTIWEGDTIIYRD